MSRYLRHVTLTTGHSRRSHRDEVADQVIGPLRDLIARMAGDAAETVPVPGMAGYSVSGRAAGRCLAAIVWADGPPAVPVATIGVAAHSRCGATLWRELHRWGEVPVVTDSERQPRTPWVAAALDAGIVRHPDATAWLGDFERCIGWAWLRRGD